MNKLQESVFVLKAIGCFLVWAAGVGGGLALGVGYVELKDWPVLPGHGQNSSFLGAACRSKSAPHMHVLVCISLGDVGEYANFVGFRGLVPLFPHLCQLSVPEVGVCGVYSESP